MELAWSVSLPKRHPLCVCRWWCKPHKQLSSTTMPVLSAPNSTASNTSSATSISTATATAPQNKLKELKRRLLVTLLTVIFYYYPSLLTTALSLFECYHIDPVNPQEGQFYPQNAQVGSATFILHKKFLCSCCCSQHSGVTCQVACLS